ncbi:MAG: hypothetical protein GY796_28550 [Chloroflexi bacterium]|nr:hypothetical protein [Chloroflexota bacterium]
MLPYEAVFILFSFTQLSFTGSLLGYASNTCSNQRRNSVVNGRSSIPTSHHQHTASY